MTSVLTLPFENLVISDLGANGNKIKENGKEIKEHSEKFCIVIVRY